MITIRKLRSLERRTRLGKCARLLYQCRDGNCSIAYLKELITLTIETADEVLGEEPRSYLTALIPLIENTESEAFALAMSDAHYLLLAAMGETVADWDLEDEVGELDASKRKIEERYLVLDRLRSPYNIGSIFRSADSFAIKKIFLIQGSADPLHSRSLRTSGGTVHTVEWEIIEAEALAPLLASLQVPVFALESGGTEITSFAFPPAGVCIIGGEELGVSAPSLQLAEESMGRVSIALGGTKGSLNVSVATAIMLQRWYSR